MLYLDSKRRACCITAVLGLESFIRPELTGRVGRGAVSQGARSEEKLRPGELVLGSAKRSGALYNDSKVRYANFHWRKKITN